MPRTRKPQVQVRSSGWKAKKHEDQASEDATAYLISTMPALQPPGIHSSPPQPANTAAADTGAVCHSSPAAAPLLPPPASGSGHAAEAISEHEKATYDADQAPDMAPCRWPAVIALLPNGCISGVVKCAVLSSAPRCRNCSATLSRAFLSCEKGGSTTASPARRPHLPGPAPQHRHRRRRTGCRRGLPLRHRLAAAAHRSARL